MIFTRSCQNCRHMTDTYTLINKREKKGPDSSVHILSSCTYAVWLLTFAVQQRRSGAVREHLICFLSHSRSINPPVTPYSSMARCLWREDRRRNLLMAWSKALRSFASSLKKAALNWSNVTWMHVTLTKGHCMSPPLIHGIHSWQSSIIKMPCEAVSKYYGVLSIHSILLDCCFTQYLHLVIAGNTLDRSSQGTRSPIDFIDLDRENQSRDWGDTQTPHTKTLRLAC